MFTINPMPNQPSGPLIDLLLQVETATLGHFRHDGFIDPAIRLVLPRARIAGPAVTVRIPGPDSTLLHHAVSSARPGDVLVIDRCGDTRHACWGGVTTNAARLAGIAGIIIDGPATDLGEITKAGLPVWCRGPSSLTTKFLALDSAMNVPVSVGGVAINPGDLILADESGAIVLPPDAARAAAEHAISLQEREKIVLARLAAGERLADISGATDLIRRAGAA
ncbi:RraA family protein [Niveispirillum sp. KHB5.9]|uniref:RraA family protein n=1 Tax=Niveispirillum sp. KHB5.9 TaxID=3400269 RepID=UPI003A8AAF38